MEKLKNLIEQHGRWEPLEIFIERIEVSVGTDFSISLENAKALLESIAKEICNHNGTVLGTTENFHSVLKKAFVSLGYNNTDLVNQVSRSLANIAQQMGNLRNDIGTTSHGKSLDEIRERNEKVNDFTKGFIIDSTVLVACFLIQNFEQDTLTSMGEEEQLEYQECEDFNQEWDDIYGEFSMGNYSFYSSEILFNVDRSAYITEYKVYEAEKPEL